jgi:hypothetical protein
MSTLRFLLDENVHPLYRTELLKRERTMVVWRVGMVGVPPRGTPDPEILDWCERHTFILVTNNRASMPPHLTDRLAQGRHIPGILVLNDKMSVNETVEELLLIWAASAENEYADKMLYLPLR